MTASTLTEDALKALIADICRVDPATITNGRP